MKDNNSDNEELNHEAALVPPGEDDGMILIGCEELDAVPLESEDHSLAIPSGLDRKSVV